MRSTDSAAPPRMFMHNPLSAAELSHISGSGTSWIIGGSSDENLAEENVVHGDIAAAPHAARLVAERLSVALGDALLPASESDTTGRVVIIVGTGDAGIPDKVGLLAALGLKRQVDDVVLFDEATLEAKDYLLAQRGFCYMNEDDQQDYEDTHDRRCIRAATSIMCADLSDHFELNFTDEIVVAPVLYGGRACDGSVVAILSMRVWT
jgi:hypothetical protein